jgi:uncharacterized protein YcbK (DUF882 family)
MTTTRRTNKIQHHQTPSRRHFLKSIVGATATLSTVPAWSKLQHVQVRSLDFKNLHTGETLRATYWEEGQYLGDEMKLVDRILRDHRTGDVINMDATLLDTLYVMQQLVKSSGAYHVISGYRSPATNEQLRAANNGVAKKSFHMQGKAIDVYLPGCELKNLRNAAVSIQAGGVGYYPESNFIHIDTGTVRHW